MDILFNGIDVSRWQGAINWPAVKAAGIDFAFIRAGYCSYTGSMTKDPQFEANMAGAISAGVDVGVYVYSYAKTAEAAALAARQTLEMLRGYRLSYPVAFDIEDATNVAMTPAQNTAIAKAFLSVVAEAGYCPLLYTFKSFAETELNMSELADYDFWLAHVTTQTNYAGPYTIWQHSWTGAVDGISGDVDLNRCYKDYPAFIRENGLNGYDAGNEDTGEEETGGEDTGDEETGGENTGGEETDGGNAGSEAPQVPGEPEDITYVVVKNDTLYHIAQRHGIPLRVLIQANPQIKNPNLIYVGDIINIPQKPKAES